MLVQFSVQNYKSFRDEAKLSLLASGYDKDPLTEANLISGALTGPVRLLRTAAIYGANAAGKSKLVEAMHVMRLFIMRSAASTGQKIPVVPFRLNPDTEQAPSEFELVFLHEGDLFRYGFASTAEHIVAEWLFYRPELARPKTKEIEIFYRDKQIFDAVHPRQFKIGARLIKDGMIRPDALLLSVAAQFNEVLAQRVFSWLGRFNIISGLQEEGYEGFTVSKVMNPTGKGTIMGFLQEADLGITDVRVRTIEQESDLPGNLPTDLRERLTTALTEKNGLIFGGAKAVHRVYDSSGNRTGTLEFDMEDESSGTQKYFALSGPILETLQQGDVLVIDELESKLHPNLVQKIVGLFHSPVTNPHHAQLIFNTHDSNLMTAEGPSGAGSSTPLLRRDQIWFVKKDRYGASSLYSLAGFKTDQVRKSDDFREKYLQGRYGAVPYLNEYEEGISQLVQSNEQSGGIPLAEPVGIL
ncbi:AAA family ATPase [Spirosoma rhododendri]|uniref:ATP-binding protein n=1 Tax=Spirosoma rhododendri TaxID=2728024 RepID=A0A7L5DW86_9BACT|nr:ATP-binding protein [Spirosoma rhododendri]QJD81623.1 ATP-binding protein [Spirosoma rhododendri]